MTDKLTALKNRYNRLKANGRNSDECGILRKLKNQIAKMEREQSEK